MSPPIRILVVDDSPLFVEALCVVLEEDPGLVVVGTAENGRAAVEQVVALEPDLVAMDVQMPDMDGLEAVERIMERRPTPILLLTGDPARTGGAFTFEALSRGALDLIPKPALDGEGANSVESLREHVRLLASVPVVYRRRRRPWVGGGDGPPERTCGSELQGPVRGPPTRVGEGKCGVVGLVASTGGPPVLADVLAALPASFPCPIVVVQHLADGFSSHLVNWLDGTSALTVRLAKDGDRLVGGTVLVAPEDAHLRVTALGRVQLDTETPPVAGHRPSGDVLLESLATNHGSHAIGVVMTGMGADGANGLKALRDAGGQTIAQDEATSAVYGMPKAAIELAAARVIVPRYKIASALIDLSGTLVAPRPG